MCVTSYWLNHADNVDRIQTRAKRAVILSRRNNKNNTTLTHMYKVRSLFTMCQFLEIDFSNLIFANSSISLRNYVLVGIKKESISKLWLTKLLIFIARHRSHVCSHLGLRYQNLMSPILIANHASRQEWSYHSVLECLMPVTPSWTR